MNEVEIIFKDRAIQKGEVTLFTKGDASEFIEACAQKKVKVLGIDGFLVFDEKIQPSMENSIDFTLKSFQGDPIQTAKELLERSDDKMFFEIICE